MAGGATKFFEARHFMFFIVAAISGLHLGDYVHGSKQRDATLETLAHLFAALVESQLASRTHGVTIVAVMMFEDVGGEFFGRFAGEVCVLLSLGVVMRLLHSDGWNRRNCRRNIL